MSPMSSARRRRGVTSIGSTVQAAEPLVLALLWQSVWNATLHVFLAGPRLLATG